MQMAAASGYLYSTNTIKRRESLVDCGRVSRGTVKSMEINIQIKPTKLVF